MKKFLLLLLALLPVVTMLAQVDSSAYDAYQGKAGIADVAEEDPGLFMVMMIFLAGVIIAAIICFAIAGLLTLFTFLMIAAGIVSISVFMAWYKRSIYTGIQWLVYLSFVIVGIGGASFICLLLDRFGNTGYSLKAMLSWGIPAGLAGGLLGGWVLLTVSRMLYRHFAVNRQSAVDNRE